MIADVIVLNQMLTHTLVLNLRGSTWDMIPHDLWRSFMHRFAAEHCDGIAFDNVSDPALLSSFTDHQPQRIDGFNPKPDPDNEITDSQQELSVFVFDSWVARLISDDANGIPVYGEDQLPVDNIYLWRDETLVVHAEICESHLYFYSLTSAMRSDLIKVDNRISDSLYAR